VARKANAALALIWKRRIAQQRRSQLSIAEFCSQEGVSLQSFYAWKKRLREVAADKKRRRGSAAAEESSRNHNDRLFVPVHLPPAAVSLDGLRIELPSGVLLTLPADASSELVTTTIQAVVSSDSSAEPPSC
jgi:hypothetical protein